MNQLIQNNPYAAPAAELSDMALAQGPALAERGSRLGAVLIDGVIFALCYVPLVFAGGTAETMDLAMVACLVLVLAILVGNCILLYRDGQTIGKKLLGIKIVRGDGSRAGLARILFIRWLPVGLLGVIPLIGPVLSLLDALLIFRDSRLCLHDQIADTMVIKL